MVTITLHCPHCGSEALVRDGHAPMANISIAVMPVGVAAARILLPMCIPQLVARRFYTPTKNEAACAASPGRLGPLAQLYPVGSKKGGDATPACLILFVHRYNLDRAILLK